MSSHTYFQKKLRDNVKNSKKTWETLNEVLGKSKNNATVEKININGQLSTDPTEISNHFNSFFTQIGKNISNSIPPIQKKPEDFIQYGREIPELNLTNTTPEHVKKVIRGLAPKQSCDVFGTSTKLVKFIGDSIAIPLAHIFNLSSKAEMQRNVITTGQSRYSVRFQKFLKKLLPQSLRNIY